jgi:hypothetical protein
MAAKTKTERVQDLAALEDLAQLIAKGVAPAFDETGVGFALVAFEFGPGGWLTYVSNAQRADMIRGLREMIEKLESGETVDRTRPLVVGSS